MKGVSISVDYSRWVRTRPANWADSRCLSTGSTVDPGRRQTKVCVSQEWKLKATLHIKRTETVTVEAAGPSVVHIIYLARSLSSPWLSFRSGLRLYCTLLIQCTLRTLSLTHSHTHHIHSNSSALNDYRDYTGIRRSKSLNLRTCKITTKERETGCEWVCEFVHVPSLFSETCRLISPQAAPPQSGALCWLGQEQQKKKGRETSPGREMIIKHIKVTCFCISHRILLYYESAFV